MKKLFKELEQLGWIIEKTKKHIKLRHELHGMVTCSSTPSCPFVEHKIRADIRRAEKGYWRKNG